MVKLVKTLNDRQVIVDCDGRTFIVSESKEWIVPVEVLVFPCDAEGNVTSWTEVGGEIGVHLDKYLEKLFANQDLVAPWRFEEPETLDDDLPW